VGAHNVWWYLLVLVVLVALCFAIAHFGERWLWLRQMRKAAFDVWFERVKVIYAQYNRNPLKDRTLADWESDFKAGLSPEKAAKAQLNPAPKNFFS
jgi:hypothetical protein